MEIGIIGAGAWGSCLAHLLSYKVKKIIVWCRNSSFAQLLNSTRENKKYLEGVRFEKNVNFTSEIVELQQCEHIFIAVPCVYLRNALKIFRDVLKGKLLYSSIKGIEEETLYLPSQIIKEEIPRINRVILLMGPTLAAEMVKKLPTTLVISSEQKEDFEFIVELFSGFPFRCYFNDDYKGVEFGGAIKNVYAIAFGIVAGLQLGFNAAGALLSRILFEISKIAKEFCIRKETIYGISCLSDLITSGFGCCGRNFRVGYFISQGKSLSQILEMMPHTPEGIYTLRAIKKLIQNKNVELPIATLLYDILYNNMDVKEGISKLLSRPLVEEFYKI